MTSLPSDRPSRPAWPRSVPPAAGESGEHPSASSLEAVERFKHIQRLQERERERAKRLGPADREVDAVAPARLPRLEMGAREIGKRRCIAALEEACYEADSQRRFAKLAGVDEKQVRQWIELPQINVPMYLMHVLPEHLAAVFLRHVVRHWGSRTIREFRDFCSELLGESEDGPRARAS